MEFNETRLYSVITGTCPKCHGDKVFVTQNPYNLKKMSDMNYQCKGCGMRFEPEPGFFWGAMFVSYALTVGVGMIIVGIMMLMGASMLMGIVTICALFIVLTPATFRYSRMIWLNIFYGYEKQVKE